MCLRCQILLWSFAIIWMFCGQSTRGASLSCGMPPRVSNAQAQYQSTNFGAIVNYVCYQGYTLIGESQRTCRVNGKWDGVAPTCLRTCSLPDIPFSTYIIKPTNYNRTYLTGEIITLACKKGFKKQPGGNPIRVCINGRWTQFPFKCKEIDCGVLPTPDKARKVFETHTRIGGVVRFECEETGYEISGSKMRTCSKDGLWSGFATSCKKECNNKLGMEDKGIPDDSITSSSQLNSNHRAIFARLEGENAWCSALGDNSPYIQILLDEEKSITAIETQGSGFASWSNTYDVHYWKEGKWLIYKKGLTGNRNIGGSKRNNMKPPFRTEKIRIYPRDPSVMFSTTPKVPCLRLELYGCSAPASCPDPGVPQNGQRDSTEFGHEKKVQFTCNSGFWLVGSRWIVCNKGKWSDDIPKCKAVCSDPGIPRNGKRIGDDFGDGQMVAYICDPKFDLVGTPTSFCVSGHWNSTRPTCKASCSDPGVPQHGQRIGSNFGHGSKVTFVCLPEHSLVGSHSMICHDGKWSSVLPVCKAFCIDPGSPQNGVRHGNEFGNNKRISFTCLPGFQLIGSNSAVCINGKWSAAIPRCKAVCRDPGVPVNGSRIGNSFLDGQTVAFRCQPGHSLIGSQVLLCVAGKWDDDMPQCKASCPDPAVPSNSRVLDSRTGNRHGDRVQFSCDSGFIMEGSSTIRCNNGQWSSPAPLCKELCKDPGIPSNGARKGDNFQHGKRVSFTCNDGYSLVGNRLMTCWEGEWSSAFPQCKKSCSNPGALQNGRRRGNDFRHGKEVTFLCQRGFKLTGISSITCNDGTWSNKVPVCTAICRDPGIPQHGARQGSDFESGKTVNFTCSAGYTLVGSKTIECQNGIWSSALPQCKNFCANPGSPQNGRRLSSDFRHGKTVTFLCQHGFTLSGVSSITCNDGRWSDEVPVCTANCKDPGILQHGARKGNSFAHGERVSFTCNAGYTLVGSKTIECRKGLWSSPLPQCKKTCADPGTPQNGQKRGNDFRHLKKVTFLCQRGFKLTGISSITCNDGTWSDKVPLCRALCKIPSNLNNGVISTNKFDNEGIIELSCHHGYKLIGSAVLRCVSGHWNDSIPQCRKDACSSPPNLAHGSYNGNDFSSGRSVTYSCHAQYVLEGPAVITCVDGQWVGQAPICRAPCPPPRIPTNGFAFGPNLQHESSVQFWCDAGFVLRGLSTSQCNDGQWDSPTPVCEVTCPEPANITNGFYSGSDFSEGSTVNYTCDNQYFLDGSSKITCVNGQWNTSSPVCRAPCPAPVSPVDGFVFGENYQHHGTIQFWCKKGFTLRGSEFSQCVNGKWNAPRPTCEGPSSCQKPFVPPNAFMRPSQEWFSHNERVFYGCNPPYSLLGFSIRRCNNGVWSELKFRCRAKSCGHPGIPKNGKINGYVFTYNSTVGYTCNKGYTLVGPKERICQANQTWTGTKPRCTTSCGTLPTPANGEKTEESSTSVSFGCIGKHFKLVGSATRTCLEGGQWSGRQPSCQLMVCNDPGTPLNGKRTILKGFFYTGSVRFSCNKNYKLVGVSRIFCKSDGNWSRSLPRCLAPCSKQSQLQNGRLIGNNFKHGATVSFACSKRYRLVGSKKLTCNDGTWSGVKPRCQPKKRSQGKR